MRWKATARLARHLRGRVAVMLAGALLALTQAFAQPSSRAQVLILGSYHMANPGLDYANLKADDVLAAKRQREIEEVAERLAAFKPTKVAVEVTFGRDGGMNQRYARYLTGGYSLERGEAEQIGFRVAKQMGHRRVYGIDYRKDLDVARVMAFGAQNGQGDLVAGAQRTIARVMAETDSLLKRGSVMAVLRAMNSSAADSALGLYLSLTRIGKDSLYPGADLAADWYARNLRILANLHRIIESPNDRVLVIFGAGHGPILRQFVRESPELQLVQVGEVLREER